MIRSLTDFQPTERYDGLPWTQARIEGSEASGGPFVAVETIDLDPVDADPADPATRNFTTTLAAEEQTWFRVTFLDADSNEDATAPVSVLRQAFATLADVEVRLGRGLEDADQALAEYVLRATTALIAEELGKDADWAATLDPVLPTFTAICVTRAIDAVGNPNAVQATTESLGAYSFTNTLRRSSEDFACLTEAEKRAVRGAFYGRNSAFVPTGSILDDLPVSPVTGRIAFDNAVPMVNRNGD